jgi:hypothetical protein
MSYPPPPPEPGTPDDGGQQSGSPSPSEPTAPYPGAAGQEAYGDPSYPRAPHGQPTYGYGQPGYPPPGYGYPSAPSNGKATASLIVGITTLVLSWCCGVGILGAVAIVLGVRARGEIQASQGRQTGEGMAVAGIVTGVLAVLIGLASVAVIILALVSGGYRTSYGY